uniref:Uncharacterized protein n=1 Tax=Tetranychus urticae TaxID=32264 RepID=T1KLE0_TETUR
MVILTTLLPSWIGFLLNNAATLHPVYS